MMSYIINNDINGCIVKKFTLIELLVVVAIIGILASMLLPSLSRARQTAQRAVCQSNLKQISVAFEMYGDDNDDFFPKYSGWLNVVGNGNNRPLNIYLEAPEVARCPSDTGDPLHGGDSFYTLKGTSYQMAAQQVLWGIDYTSANNNPRKRTHFTESSKKLVIGDLWHANRDWTDPKLQWHGGKNARSCNMLFLDSHVEFFRFPTEYNTYPMGQAPDSSRGFY